MDEQLQEIVRKIVEHLDPVRIYLFGSRARGDHRPDSDYDLAVIYDGEKTKRDVHREVDGLFNRLFFSMDLFVLTSDELERAKHIANTISREIDRTGVVVYG